MTRLFCAQWRTSNIKRGALRAWIVISLAWFAFVFTANDGASKTIYAIDYALNHKEIQQQLDSPKHRESSYLKCMREADLIYGEIGPSHIDLMEGPSSWAAKKKQREWEARSSACHETVNNRHIKEPDMRWLALAVLPQTVGLALLVLLLHGAYVVLRWIADGFKQDT